MIPPTPGAGDILGSLPAAGMGNYFNRPFPGLGLGDPLLDLPTILNATIINSELIRIVTSYPCLLETFKLQEFPPYGRAFVLSYDRTAPDTYFLVTTPLTPNGPYVLSMEQVVLDGMLRVPLSIAILAQPDLENPAGEVIAMIRPRPFGLLEALTFAAGKELQAIGGRPTTRVTEDSSAGSRFLRVRSTLGFPQSGTISIDGVKVSYVDKVDTAFELAEYSLAQFTIGEIVSSVHQDIESRSRL
jgi:hypothetical protein